ncbi:hypothetical protein CHLNCDRAFT_135485 [Chlorella variabilis]|uniref:Phosphoribulokinase/uridine kinase domain-containing protein n=1 Tax=Chlorella variabilis TaxID=554065 RepID=E1ZIA0_CHLVA|nr:hypothetical protein CHLNCDRAFT_135485 [Chlorella variabilis]EFN54119.1 hypothetical protein CHLNCDRAFT_135485 [Chlorella variabilis]|eukprot:XP_005846221.1 hypothetical protein CHLNCDRAFT_135485 [Chlorella variabilis]
MPKHVTSSCCWSTIEALQPSFSDTTPVQAAAAAAPAGGSSPLEGASTMEDVYDLLAGRVEELLQQRGPGAPKFMVGVAGVPGSGKSSLAKAVVELLNQRGTPAVNVPMDGFHFFRRQLDQMPDPQLAHARRGAEWTFDARAYHACLADIKHTGQGAAPSFDHGVGDPRPGDIAVEAHHAVVVSEGNYLLLAAEPWWRLRQLFDDTWFIDCQLDVAMQRVFERQTGNGVAAEVSRWRIAANDRPNAEQVETTRGRAALVVPTLLLS